MSSATKAATVLSAVAVMLGSVRTGMVYRMRCINGKRGLLLISGDVIIDRSVERQGHAHSQMTWRRERDIRIRVAKLLMLYVSVRLLLRKLKVALVATVEAIGLSEGSEWRLMTISRSRTTRLLDRNRLWLILTIVTAARRSLRLWDVLDKWRRRFRCATARHSAWLRCLRRNGRSIDYRPISAIA